MGFGGVVKRWVPACLLAGLIAVPGWAQAVKRPAITGLAYARFYESDLLAAKQFFGQRLGLPETDLASGAVSFAVGMRQRVEIVALPSPAPADRLAMVAFLTPDVRGMRRYLESKGISVEVHGADEIRLKDPEGNAIAFVREARAAGKVTAMKAVGEPGAATSRRMIHAGFGVRSAAAEDAFYRGVLGFTPYWHGGMKDDGGVDWSSLQVPEGADWIEYMLEFRPGQSQRMLGVLDHISLGVEHITDADRQLIANGWTDASTRKSQIGRDGKWQLNVFDPDQSRVEFMEFRPVREPCCSPLAGRVPGDDAE